MMDNIVINYHITEKCNYVCKHCFAEYGLEDQFKMEQHHDLAQVEIMLKDIYKHYYHDSENNNIRINFAGGEPMIVNKFSDIIKIAYDIGFEVSLITNGSALNEVFIRNNAGYLSVFGISIDSFQDVTNINIGRVTRVGKGNKTDEIIDNINLIREINPNIFIKINTVISQINFDELMFSEINRISPDKWKIFEVLPNVKGEGHIIEDQFKHFVSNHKEKVNSPMFVENKDDLLDSYIMIDPLGRFYQRQSVSGRNIFSDVITIVGTERALDQVTFDPNKFKKRYIPLVVAA